MTPKRPINLIYLPRLWPAFAVSSGVALILWPLAVAVGHKKGFLIFAAVAFCAGILTFALSFRRMVGFIPLVLHRLTRASGCSESVLVCAGEQLCLLCYYHDDAYRRTRRIDTSTSRSTLLAAAVAHPER
jgi:hypothetical protein